VIARASNPASGAARERAATAAEHAEAASESGRDIPWVELVTMVRRTMRSLVGASSELEDLAQTALERVVRGAERFEGRAELGTYVYRVCVRVALNHWRGWRRWFARFDLGTERAPEPADEGTDAHARMWIEARARRLHRLLARLDPMRRVVLTLVDLEELPPARVAEILECPEPTVRSRLRQARLELEALVLKDPWFVEEAARAKRESR
jgi:RNA polymerase sigma-70 factor (ECF subfamily)